MVKRVLVHEIHDKEKYRPRDSDEKGGVVNQPMLRHLISEVDFLTNNSMPSDHVIIAVGNTMQHLPFLQQMFPALHFHIHVCVGDAKTFESEVEYLLNSPNVSMVERSFHNGDANSYKAKLSSGAFRENKILFICNSRTLNPKNMTDAESTSDKLIKYGMKQQARWVRALGAKASLLKLRLPYDAEENLINFLDGEMRFQPFAQRSSTEVRLVVHPGNEGVFTDKGYNIKVHEDCMFHHNNVTRREHMHDNATSTLSYDQLLAHDVLHDWCMRALHHPETHFDANSSPNMLGDDVFNSRVAYVDSAIKMIDQTFKRTLSLRAGERFARSVIY